MLFCADAYLKRDRWSWFYYLNVCRHSEAKNIVIDPEAHRRRCFRISRPIVINGQRRAGRITSLECAHALGVFGNAVRSGTLTQEVCECVCRRAGRTQAQRRWTEMQTLGCRLHVMRFGKMFANKLLCRSRRKFCKTCLTCYALYAMYITECV